MPRIVESPDPALGLWSTIAFHLRVWRHMKQQTQSTVARILNSSTSSVSRLELGQDNLGEEDAAKLDAVWETGGLFAHLVYHAIRGHSADWHAQHLNLEASAHMLRIYESLVFPGIFQTEAYARALVLSGLVASRVDEVIAERMKRSVILERTPPPDVWVIISQNVLEWPVGGPSVMREQLGHLLDLAKLPHVGIRVLPKASGASPGLDGSFKIMTLDSADVAFSESSGGGRLVQDPAGVRGYRSRYERIGASALTRVDSLALIQRFMEDMK